jgi:hypothetical protein
MTNKTEIQFSKLVNFTREATKHENIHSHFDLIIDGNIKVDVKQLKKRNRTDSLEDPTIHFVEFQNVNGNKGWIYGEATYIAFEQPDCFIMVNRKKLGNYYCDVMKGNTEVVASNDNKEIHTWYTRKGRLDIIIMVNTSDLYFIKDYIIKK